MNLKKCNYIVVHRLRSVNILSVCDALNIPYVRESYNEYHLAAHDSLKLHPVHGWYWFSKGIGGNAIDFLIEFAEMTFKQAKDFLLKLVGFAESTREGQSLKKGIESLKSFIKRLNDRVINNSFNKPHPYKNNDRVTRYLTEKRSIDKDIVNSAIKTGKLYESSQYHNCVFAGLNQFGNMANATLRSCSGKWKGNAKGSDKKFTFQMGNTDSKTVHVFESPIDALSYMTLEKMKDLPSNHTYISLDGASIAPLMTYLSYHPHVRNIKVHTDNDDTGFNILKNICKTLNQRKYYISDERPTTAKDVNEYLQSLVKA